MSGGRQPGRAPGRPNATRKDRRRAEVQRRRDSQRRSVQQAARRRHRRIAAGVLAGVLVVGATATAVVLVRQEDPAPPELTSEVVGGATGELGVTEPPASYRAVYEVITYGEGAEPTTMTEEVVVRRPFDSLLAARQGPAPGSTSQWQLTSNLGRYAESVSGAEPEVQAITPRSALGDYRLDASLADLVADGTFVPRERRRALDRDCQVYRTGSPVESLATSKPTEASYSDVCIDAAGIPLEEVTVTDGQLASRLQAVSVDVEASTTDDTFAITGTPVALDAGGAELTPIEAAELPPGAWQPGQLPEGYTLQGHYRFRQPPADAGSDAATTTTTAPAAPAVRESYASVYVHGIDTIVVLQGPSAAEPASEAREGAAVEVGALGSATTATGLTGSTLLAHPPAPAGWFVEVAGTVGRAQLQELASSLQA